MEIAFSVVTDIAIKLVDATILQARYPFRFKRYAKELETEKEKLQSKVDGVLYDVKQARKKTEKVVSNVEKWLEEAEILIVEVVELQEKAEKRKMTSCLKCCPNLIRRYSLAKQLEEKANEIIQHRQIQFSKFSRLATLVGLNSYFSSEGFLPFKSRQVAYDGILEALKDGKVHLIGLYGMGGCGKTTLAKEVSKEAEIFFEKVVFVVVSNPIDVRKIQDKIASQLELEFKEEEEPDRARRLFMRLTGGERILIILDDVWEKLDFEAIGIPVTKSQMGCTTLVTTRKLDVCRVMNCQSMVPLEGLNEDEAWTLFQMHVGTFYDDFDMLKGLAQEITKQCGGLPVAIAAMASTLKGKPQVEWDEALKTLKASSIVDIEEGLKNPYTCLQVSYDNLKNEEAKSLLLLCSIFPEDHEIPIDRLTIIGIGLGLIEKVDFDSYQSARNQVIRVKNKLIDCCLLLKVDEEGTFVKMHDLVRDVALWIAKRDNKLIMAQEKSQKALKKGMVMKDDRIRYLWFNEVVKFPHKLDCPELEFLHISTKSKHAVDIKNDFFKGMEKLRILILEDSTLNDLLLQLPMSIHLMNNLRCLFLHGWLLGDISFIGSLERLESLTLWRCSFDELPTSIIQQKDLRLLDLWKCKIKKNSFEVIGRCSQLEVLYFCDNKGMGWEDQGENGVEFFDKVRPTPTMESYCLNLGKNYGHFERQVFPITRSLYIKDFETCTSNATIMDLIQRSEVLSLRGIHKSCRNIIPDLFQTIGGGMNELAKLSLYDSDGIECILNTRNHLDQVGIFSKLTHLTLVGMKHLKTLCHGQSHRGLFAKLEVLILFECSSLEHIITNIEEEIVVDDSNHQRTDRFSFPKLKKLIIRRCNQLIYLMPISFAHSLVELEEIKIDKADKLESVFGHSIHDDASQNKIQIIEFLALKVLTLRHLQSIVSICPENYYPRWPSLEWLQLHNCPQLNLMPNDQWVASSGLRQADHIASKDLAKAVLSQQKSLLSVSFSINNKIEVIFHVEGLPDNGQQVNSSLKYLELYSLQELRYIWMGSKNFLCLQNLGELRIEECGNLKVVFSTSILRNLPQLKKLQIEKCKELEVIIEDDEENQNLSDVYQVVFPNLTAIIIRDCHKLTRVFPVSSCCVVPKLRILVIEEASQLEQVFGREEGDTTRRKEDVIPNLEYVIFRKLPRLTMGGQCIDLQTVKYMVVQESPILAHTSIITPREMLEILERVDIANFDGRAELEFLLRDIIKSNEDYGRETNKQIDGKESGVELAPAMEHISSHAPLASPNSSEIVKELDDQGGQEPNISKEKCVKVGVEEGSTSEQNAKIVTPSRHSEPTSSLLGTLVTSMPLAPPQSLNETMPGLKIPAVMPASSTDPKLINKQLATNPFAISPHKTPSHEAELVNKISVSESSLKDQQWLLGETEITNNGIPQEIKGVKEPEDSAQEGNISKKNDAKGSVEDSISENAKIVSSLEAHPHIQNQNAFDQTGTDHIDKDIEATPMINLQDIKDDNLIGLLQSMEEDYGGELPVVSITPKDELVAKALGGLEDSLKMSFKDIATSKANSLRLQMALNFLSRLSLEDGALSHELKAIIDSLRQDFPTILSSFRQAFTTINKFTLLEEREKSMKEELVQRKEAAIALVSEMSKNKKFMDEAQEKEARLKEQISRLEKEMRDCEADLLSLQERKKKCVAENVEFKKEFESVREKKLESVEDQGKARQTLFQIDYKWSVLCSQLEHNVASKSLS